MDSKALSSVMVMDTWSEAPSMRVARLLQSACVLDGKIYVTGGFKNLDSKNWTEVFATKTQTWEFLEIHSQEICSGSEYKTAGYEGTLYVRSEAKNVTYKLNRGRWREADIAMNNGWHNSSSYCVIGNVVYRYNHRTIDWYDSKNRLWTTLKGLERLPSLFRYGHITLADYGGKMAVLWREYVIHHKQLIIWCAEIAIDEKRQKGEIWGTLDWFGIVSTTNEPYSLVNALATTI